jgi:hypothetical protein
MGLRRVGGVATDDPGRGHAGAVDEVPGSWRVVRAATRGGAQPRDEAGVSGRAGPGGELLVAYLVEEPGRRTQCMDSDAPPALRW